MSEDKDELTDLTTGSPEEENAALLNRSGLCLEDAVAVLQRIAAGETVTG